MFIVCDILIILFWFFFVDCKLFCLYLVINVLIEKKIGFWTWIWSTRQCGLRQKWLVDFNAEISWFCLTVLITLVWLMWKWMGLFMRKNHLLRCWGWLSLLNWIGALTLSLLLKLPPRKLVLWLFLWSFFVLRLFCISVNLPYTTMHGILLSCLGWCS